MTARVHIEVATFEIDLTAPGVYRAQVNLALMIAKYIEAVKLEDVARMADDVCKLALLNKTDPLVLERMRSDRAVVEILLSAQRQLSKVHGGSAK